MEDNSKQGKPVVTVYPAGSDDKSQPGELVKKAAGVAPVAIASGDDDDESIFCKIVVSNSAIKLPSDVLFLTTLD